MPSLQNSEYQFSTVVTTKENIGELPITSGQHVYEKTNGHSYFDWDGTRIDLSSVVVIDSTAEDFPVTGREDVIYIKNGKLYMYDSTLKSYNELAKNSFVWGTF